jgi:hypothetical protein
LKNTTESLVEQESTNQLLSESILKLSKLESQYKLSIDELESMLKERDANIEALRTQMMAVDEQKEKKLTEKLT